MKLRGIHDAVKLMNFDEAILRSLGYEGDSENSDSDTDNEAIDEAFTGASMDKVATNLKMEMSQVVISAVMTCEQCIMVLKESFLLVHVS